MDTLIVGIDGLDPELLRRWEDDLEVLPGLIRRGRIGRLRSTDPPLTAPAWPGMFTGKQGGKHGVFGFTTREDGSYARRPINYDDVHAESLWEALDHEGVRVGVANVPLTYPPSDLDYGFVIAGWPVPPKAEVCNAPWVVDAMEADIGESYQVNPFPVTGSGDDLPTSLLAVRIEQGLRHHARAFEHLLRAHRDRLDAFFCVFMAIDIASHHFAFKPSYLRDIYRQQDRALETVLEAASEDVNIILMSDHGHGARGELSFHVNDWLQEKGYLTVDEDLNLRMVLERLGITKENYIRVANRFGLGRVHEQLPRRLYTLADRLVPQGDKKRREFRPQAIDWSKTLAYSGLQNEIFLNAGDHPEGVVAADKEEDVRRKLQSALETVEHPDGGPLISRVATKEELFRGPFVDKAPDLVFVADEMRCNAPMGFRGQIFSEARWGEHRQHGVFLSTGPSFASGSTWDVRDIHDVYPLVLALHGVGIPEDVDGVIPDDRLSDEVVPQFRRSRDSVDDGGAYDESESEAVESQLQALGYLE